MSDKPASVGDVNTAVFLHAVKDGMPPVRAMCENTTTGEKFEVVGIDRGEGEVVPLFLVPIGGAEAIVTRYTVIKDDPLEVNPFNAEVTAAPSSALH